MFHYLRITFLYFLIVLLSLEAVLYVLDAPKSCRPHSIPEQFQSTVGMKSTYTNKRSISIEFIYDCNPRDYFRDNNTIQHITNSAGFRGPEISAEKQKNTYRILFLGDSITFGEGVYFEDTYPEQFRTLIQKENVFKDKTVESINAGVGGYNTRDEYALLEDTIDLYKIKPDRVVVGYYLNDVDEPLFKVNADGKFMRVSNDLESFITSTKNTPGFLKFFRTFLILRNWYMGEIITEKTIDYYHAAYKDDNPSWLETKKAISNFGVFQKTTGIPVTFIIFPALFKLGDYPFVVEQNKVIKELENNDLKYVSLLRYLSDYKGPELWVHPTDQHPNEIVHRIAAQALVDKLSQ